MLSLYLTAEGCSSSCRAGRWGKVCSPEGRAVSAQGTVGLSETDRISRYQRGFASEQIPSTCWREEVLGAREFQGTESMNHVTKFNSS